MSQVDTSTAITFEKLGLPESIIEAITALGYEKPTPIQQACIPALLAGKDVLGMAQTGSGKTAAFALPLLSRINPALETPQLLVLTPTRELAIQVSKAFKDYTKNTPGLKTLAIYGGQRYEIELRGLRQGAQVIVGTPGRISEYLGCNGDDSPKRKTVLDCRDLQAFVLDEADEMLRQGFLEAVEAIMQKLPQGRQMALFSATMPEAIRRITLQFMQKPEVVHTQSHVRTAPEITQHYWLAYRSSKMEALPRFLETEVFDAAIIFVRTKNATLEVVEYLKQKGNTRCAAINGDMNQSQRDETIERFRIKREDEDSRRLDVLIATDVAARGLDVDRITLVINYDIPMDHNSYVHRIGRTGRAGRSGKALLFVEHREQRLLANLESRLRLSITPVDLPNNQQIAERRLLKFNERLRRQLDSQDLGDYRNLLPQLVDRSDQNMEALAAALLKLAQGDCPLILPPEVASDRKPLMCNFRERDGERFSRERRNSGERSRADMLLYRIEVGKNDGVEVRHIVGAIANEGDFSSRHIGNIKLFPEHSTVELPKGLSNEMIGHLARTRILNKPMRMQLIGEANSGFSRRDRFEKGYTPRNGDRPNRQYRSSKPQTVSHYDR